MGPVLCCIHQQAALQVAKLSPRCGKKAHGAAYSILPQLISPLLNSEDFQVLAIIMCCFVLVCTTCQKAKRWLDENRIAYELRDIKQQNPTYEELAAWHQRSGLPLRKFFNTSGLLYKSMELKDKLPGMSEEDMLRLLATDGMLVKRPILVGDDLVLVGFKEAEWAERLKKINIA